MASYHRQNIHANKKKTSISYIIREKEENYHRAGVNSLQYDHDLDRLYSAGRDSVIKIWGFANEAISNRNVINSTEGSWSKGDCHLQCMEHHTDWVNDIALCCNGRNLISVSNDTTIKVWNAHQGFCLSTLRSHKDYAKCLAYAKDKEIVASAGFDRMIYLWDIQALTILTATKNTVTTKPLDGSKNSIYSLAINQSGTLVASGSTEKVIRLWDPRSRQKLLKLRGHTDNVRDLKFSKDGSMLLSASSDGTVRLWSISQQRCISIIRIHDEGVWTLQADESFKVAYSGGKDGKIFMTDLKNTANSRLVCMEDSPILKMLLVEKTHSKSPSQTNASLWVSTTDSAIKNWPVKHDFDSNLDDNEINSYRPVGKSLNPIEVPLNKVPDFTIKGNPSVINYHVLNDKRHILTQESDNSIALYDVLTARKIEHLHSATDDQVRAQELYDKEVKGRSKMIYVPNWFTVDLKIGLLCIHLEESECFSAWVSARDYGFSVESQDPKVNLGGLMLQALFEFWPPTYEDYETDIKSPRNASPESSNIDYVGWPNHMSNRQRGTYHQQDGAAPNGYGHHRVGNQYFSVASHTPIIISEGNQTILRFLAYEACNENEDSFIQEIIPSWASDVLVSKCQPKFTKIPFFLLPHSDSGIKSLRKERLSASDMLPMRKVIEHVCEKMMDNFLSENGSNLISPQDQSAANFNKGSANTSSGESAATFPIDKIELYCNDQKLDENLDLRTVRHYIWKSGGDLVLHYMPLK